jgi:hypothetical protein
MPIKSIDLSGSKKKKRGGKRAKVPDRKLAIAPVFHGFSRDYVNQVDLKPVANIVLPKKNPTQDELRSFASAEISALKRVFRYDVKKWMTTARWSSLYSAQRDALLNAAKSYEPALSWLNHLNLGVLYRDLPKSELVPADNPVTPPDGREHKIISPNDVPSIINKGLLAPDITKPVYRFEDDPSRQSKFFDGTQPVHRPARQTTESFLFISAPPFPVENVTTPQVVTQHLTPPPLVASTPDSHQTTDDGEPGDREPYRTDPTEGIAPHPLYPIALDSTPKPVEKSDATPATKPKINIVKKANRISKAQSDPLLPTETLQELDEQEQATALSLPEPNPLATLKPGGVRKPKATAVVVTHYNRETSVKAWVLAKANGVCECCNKKAPFNTIEGQPYLEVHHVLAISEGGSDTVSNVVAICPNCHRELHFGKKRATIKAKLYESLPNLINE